MGFEPKVPPNHRLVRGQLPRKINDFGSLYRLVNHAEFFQVWAKCGMRPSVGVSSTRSLTSTPTMRFGRINTKVNYLSGK
ncbi:hypothetical protein SAMN05216368_11296 [Cryobacterium flavum]|uniref:Uncharacterized protein n=1 Tax=Cryobacterium flavum TaxID=1424659 RepID=A0A5E9G209_9MICO|nr:hypothetical protein SAMN05216368_11296 [Cryobacterium flavum]